MHNGISRVLAFLFFPYICICGILNDPGMVLWTEAAGVKVIINDKTK